MSDDPGRGENTIEWIQCPNCWAAAVNVTRNLGDRGGTESFDIECILCDHEEMVIP